MRMNCFYCRGVDTIEETTTRFCSCDAASSFVVENLPASVCRLCGDESYSGETVEALEKVKNGDFRPTSVRVLRVFDFENLNQRVGQEGQSSYSRFFPGGELPTLLDAVVGSWAEPVHTAEPKTAWGAMGPEISWNFMTIASDLEKSYRVDKFKQLSVQQGNR